MSTTRNPWRRAAIHLATLTLGIALAAAPAAKTPLAQYQEAEKVAKAHIATFDDLDFQVFTHQEWERLHESHSHDVIVHWPVGHATNGIEKHIEDLKAMFVYAPDTRILQHPVKVADKEWTSVIGIMEGTFSQPMPKGDGSHKSL